MPELNTKPKTVTKASAIQLRTPATLIAGAVDRTAEFSDGMLKSLETSERAAIDALGEFVVTVEDAWPHQVVGTSEVAKTITQSGLHMADRLVHTQYDLLRHVIHSTAKSLSSHDGTKAKAA